MKRYIALLLVLVMAFSFAACAPAETPAEPTPTPTAETPADTPEATPEATPTPEAPEETPEATPDAPAEPTVMSYAEYIAAPMDSQVVVECYVQGHQSWWDNKITVYAQDEDGAYFLYEMACSEEDAAKLTTGTAIRVTGYKGEWAGEVEIMDATFEFIDGNYVAAPVDATAWLGTDELIAHQNEVVSFTGMTVEAIEYKNGEPGDDIYVTLGYGGASYSFCVEVYLTGPDTEVYTTVGTLAVGDVVDVQGFLYWYEGPNPHITAITKTGAAVVAPEETPAEPEAPVEETPVEEPEAPVEETPAEPETPVEETPVEEPAAPTNVVYFSVSVDGQIVVAAQPITVDGVMTIEDVVKEAHKQFCAEGEAGYEAGIDAMWNMFLISKSWGYAGTPYIIINEMPNGADPANPATIDQIVAVPGDNYVLSTSSNASVPARSVSIAAANGTVAVKEWVLDFATFSYKSSPLANADVVDAETGAKLGTTDANGQFTVSGAKVVTVGGLAAIPVNVPTNSADIG